MDENEADGFFKAMVQDAPEGRVLDMADAIEWALTNVNRYDGPRWFGSIAGGTFYADANRSYWFPDSMPAESIGSIKVELGEVLTDGLGYF